MENVIRKEVMTLSLLSDWLTKQSPEVASRMAARGLIWSPERHRWIRKPDVSTQSVLPQITDYGEMEQEHFYRGRDTIDALLNSRDKLSSWEKEFLLSVQKQLTRKGNLSDKQWDTVEKINSKFKTQKDNSNKQKKGLTEKKAAKNIIVRPNNARNPKDATIIISGEGAFHLDSKKWLEENGFIKILPRTKRSGPSYMRYKISTEDQNSILQEALTHVDGMEGTLTDGSERDKKYSEKMKELTNKHMEEVMDKIPELRDKGFTLKRGNEFDKTTKVWKMLLGRK